REAQVVLADRSPGTLTAAAQAMLALGSRSTGPPPPLRAGFAGEAGGPGAANVIVVGAVPPGAPLAAAGQQRPVVFGRSGQVTLSGQRAGDRVRLSSSVGAVQEVRTPDASARQVLWLDGTSAEMVAGSAAAIYDSRLGGDAVVVDASGRLSSLGSAGPGRDESGPSTAQLGAVLAAALLIGVMLLQLFRPRGAGPPGARAGEPADPGGRPAGRRVAGRHGGGRRAGVGRPGVGHGPPARAGRPAAGAGPAGAPAGRGGRGGAGAPGRARAR